MCWARVNPRLVEASLASQVQYLVLKQLRNCSCKAMETHQRLTSSTTEQLSECHLKFGKQLLWRLCLRLMFWMLMFLLFLFLGLWHCRSNRLIHCFILQIFNFIHIKHLFIAGGGTPIGVRLTAFRWIRRSTVNFNVLHIHRGKHRGSHRTISALVASNLWVDRFGKGMDNGKL